jgi:preprotein translocase subunit SecB
MKMSPLQVQHYHFTSISISTRQDIDMEKTEFDSGPYPLLDSEKINTRVQLGLPDDDDEDTHQFALLLQVEYTPPKKSHFPYSFSVSLEGVFSIDHDGDIDERKRLVVCNGAAMLYGAAREQLLTLTARHRFGPMMLPAADFRGLGPEQPSEASEPPPGRKKKIK